MIPYFYGPVNRFTDRLVYIGILRRVPEEAGGLEVVGIPTHGHLSVAAVGRGALGQATRYSDPSPAEAGTPILE